MIVVLGGFEVSIGEQAVALPAGHPTTLVKVLAIMRGAAHVDVVTELLWPDEPAGAGRARLRNVVSRVRAAVPGLVERAGDQLVVDAAAIDLAAFEAQVHAALQAEDRESRRDHAIAAVSLYRGDVLPSDPYATWVLDSRDRARRQLSTMLDLLIDDDLERDDVDDAVRWLERATEVEERPELRHAHAAELLADDHPGRALRHARRARAIVDDLGVAPTPRLVAVERRLGLA